MSTSQHTDRRMLTYQDLKELRAKYEAYKRVLASADEMIDHLKWLKLSPKAIQKFRRKHAKRTAIISAKIANDVNEFNDQQEVFDLTVEEMRD